MPRSKKATETTSPEITTAIEPTETPTESAAPKPKRTRAKATPKPVEEVAAQEPVAEAPLAEEPKPKTRSRRKVKALEPKPEPVVEATAPEPEPQAVESAEPPKRTRPSRRRKAEPAPSEPSVVSDADLEASLLQEVDLGQQSVEPAQESELDLTDFEGEEHWIPVWRPKAVKTAKGRPQRQENQRQEARNRAKPEPTPAAPVEEPAASAEAEDPNLAPRRRRRRDRKPRTEAAPVAEATPQVPEPEPAPKATRERGRRGARPVAEPQAPAEPPKPTVPAREPVATPAEAPQVVQHNGMSVVVRDHRIYPPLWFFGSPTDEKRLKTVMEQVKQAAEAGVHIHALLLDLEVDPTLVDETAQFAAYLLKKAVEADPEAQVVFRIVFVAPRGWDLRYQRARFSWLDGTLAEPSICDDQYWGAANECLDGLVRRLRLLGQKDHIMGVQLDRGEWFYPEDNGYDNSAAARDKFRDWARTRYNDDVVSLRAAWFDGQVDFRTISVPPFERSNQRKERFMRTERKQRRWVDYHFFLSDATVFRIGELAYTAKKASDGHFLVGVSYGYSFEWSHPYSGHLSLGKLLRTREVDFIAGPPSYKNRTPGEAAPFPGPVDSFSLNGKLYVSEEDFKTSISNIQEPDEFNPVIKTPQALESVHWRGLGVALAHGSGVCWMDLWGNGWLRPASVWTRAQTAIQSLVRRLETPMSPPDVAVFIDERSLAYLGDPTGFNHLVRNVRDAVLKSGLSAAFYLLSDLAHREVFPESKLYIFLNAWDMRPEYRSAIKSRLQRDGKVLFWLYGAGLFDGGRESLERVREITGIALRPQPFNSKSGTTIRNRRHPFCESFDEKHGTDDVNLEPSYFAIPEDASVLGEYTQTGLPSFVVHESRHAREPHLDWTSVFLGEPPVPAGLIRALAQAAGAHVWSFGDDVVHVRPPFLTFHATSSGPRTLALPDKWSAYDVLNESWVAEDSRQIRFHAIAGTTSLFMVGPRHDLEAMLATDPATVLRLENLPERRTDTLSQDQLNFDIPIIKLDEWMVGEEGDESADDIFFWPKIDEVAAEAEPEDESEADDPSQTGRRRRRRRKKRGNGGGERAEGYPEADINIVFRKRE